MRRREDFVRVGISLWRRNDLEASHGCTSSSLLAPATILLEFNTWWVGQCCKPQDEYFKAIIAPIDVPRAGLGYSPCFTNAQIPTAHNRSNISDTANCSASTWSPVAELRKSPRNRGKCCGSAEGVPGEWHWSSSKGAGWLLFRWNLIAGSRHKTGSPGEENRFTSAFLIRRNSLLRCPDLMVALQRHQIARLVPQKPLQKTRIRLGDAMAHLRNSDLGAYLAWTK